MKRSGLYKLGTTYWYTALVIALTACNSNDMPSSTAMAPSENSTADSIMTQLPSEPMDLNAQIEFSRKDLAQQLGVEIDLINLTDAQQVTWRSGALGCPQKGMNYTQALVPGTLILLDVDGEIHEYHAKHGGQPFNCPRERIEPPLSEQRVD